MPGIKIVQYLYKKVGVFKIKEQAQINDDAEYENIFFNMFFRCSVDPVCQVIINNSRQQYKNKIKTTGLIKKVKRKQDEINYPQQFFLVYELVTQHEHKKEKKKKTTVEQQRIF